MQQQSAREGARLPPSARLSHLLDGYLYTQLIAIVVRLGLPDRLASGSRKAADLAAETGIDTERLRRILRGLASVGVLSEDGDGFALTEVGELLRRDVPGSLAGPAQVRGELYFPAAAELYASLMEGSIAFERAYGTDLFSYLQQPTDAGAIFQSSMAARSRVEAEATVRMRTFSDFGTIVDVGGGSGVLLEAVLRATPAVRGVLFDLPPIAAQARRRLVGSDIEPRLEIVDGDFFDDITPGGDGYLLSRVIHDWDDERAGRILGNVRKAISPVGTLMLIEAVSPERAADQPATISMDLHMLMLLAGRERTEAEFDQLLRSAGFELDGIVDLASPTGARLIEARPV